MVLLPLLLIVGVLAICAAVMLLDFSAASRPARPRGVRRRPQERNWPLSPLFS